jgi:phage tail-like protein
VSCAAPPTFRLLDGYVGWDAVALNGTLGLEGTDEGEALELAIVGGGVDPAGLIGYLPPPMLARGCGPCEWYLVTPAPNARVLVRGCDGFHPVRGTAGFPGILVAPVAIATRGRRIAVADPGAGLVRVWVRGGATTAAVIPIAGAQLVALASGGELLVIAGGQLLRFRRDGAPLGPFSAPLPLLPPGGAYDRLAVGDDCAVWLVTRAPAVSLDGTSTTAYYLWRAAPGDAAFVPATLSQLAGAFAPTDISAASPAGFCLTEAGPDGSSVTSCWDWNGAPLPPGVVQPIPPPMRERLGQLLTVAIDGGIPRCRWHRVRLDADVPFGTALEIAVSTSELANPTPQGVAAPPWVLPFPAGVPHPDDWQVAPPRALDFLVDQPPGRYLFVRLRFTGDTLATPRVRRVRLDLPRVTSLEHLPAVYREQPDAEDFTERFLSLFDASVGELDRAIERAPALLDSDGVPETALPWLAGFLDIALDPAWTTAQRRAILAAAPELYRKRGTVAGLQQTIALVAGATPVIEELSRERLWGALGRTARVRGTRLYGRDRARFVLDRSPLGKTPLRSFGSPEQDPFADLAFRFRVLMPPAAGLLSANGAARLERLVQAQKPAHTAATVRVGGAGFVVGVQCNVGVDSVLAALPPPILGRNLRLRRMSVLWGGRDGGAGSSVGATSAVGMVVCE